MIVSCFIQDENLNDCTLHRILYTGLTDQSLSGRLRKLQRTKQPECGLLLG